MGVDEGGEGVDVGEETPGGCDARFEGHAGGVVPRPVLSHLVGVDEPQWWGRGEGGWVQGGEGSGVVWESRVPDGKGDGICVGVEEGEDLVHDFVVAVVGSVSKVVTIHDEDVVSRVSVYPCENKASKGGGLSGDRFAHPARVWGVRVDLPGVKVDILLLKVEPLRGRVVVVEEGSGDTIPHKLEAMVGNGRSLFGIVYPVDEEGRPVGSTGKGREESSWPKGVDRVPYHPPTGRSPGRRVGMGGALGKEGSKSSSSSTDVGNPDLDRSQVFVGHDPSRTDDGEVVGGELCTQPEDGRRTGVGRGGGGGGELLGRE